MTTVATGMNVGLATASSWLDPPWDQGKTGKRSVRQYPTMTWDQIAALPIGSGPEESFLWLWATQSFAIKSQAFELMEHWGFRALLTWDRLVPCHVRRYQITTERLVVLSPMPHLESRYGQDEDRARTRDT